MKIANNCMAEAPLIGMEVCPSRRQRRYTDLQLKAGGGSWHLKEGLRQWLHTSLNEIMLQELTIN